MGPWTKMFVKYAIILLLFVLVFFTLPLFSDELTEVYTDKEIIAVTLILEAGGEYKPKSMEAVYEVLYNRAIRRGATHDLEKRLNEKVVIEALRRKQFSCWNNINKRNELMIKGMKHQKYAEALRIVNEPITNWTGGATHYHTKAVNPYWAKTLTKTITIQNHIFYK